MREFHATALVALIAVAALSACKRENVKGAASPADPAPSATPQVDATQTPGASAVPAKFALLTDASAAELQSLSSLVEPALRSRLHNSPALVVGVLKGGKRYVFAYGDADDKGTKPDGRTTFEIGAISQPLIGQVLAQLVSEGRVKLDDPVKMYLPAGKSVPEKNGKAITLRHLVTHTSGLPREDQGFFGRTMDMLRAPTAMTEAAFWENIAKAKLGSDPGSAFEFSNLGVSLLAYALAERDGRPWDQMVAARVTAPFSMADTAFSLDAAGLARKAVGHSQQGIALDKARTRTGGAMGPASGMHASANDLLQLAGAQMRAAETPTASAVYESLRILFTADHGETGVAHNWFHKLLKSGRSFYVYSAGATDGFNAHLRFYQDRQLAVAVLSNRYRLDVGLVPPRVENEVENIAEAVATAIMNSP